ncbi:MAG: RNA polymerase sigma factor [Nannocystaceae bacterium]
MDLPDPSDRALLDAWRGGDRRAGSALFHRHYTLVNRFFRSKADAADVADLIQSTFMACVEGKERYEGTGEFKSYLLGIAFRLLCRHYRSKRRLNARVEVGSVSAFDLAPSPSQVVAAGQEQRLILAALRRIPLEHQALLELVFWEEFTAADAAAALGLPLGTVKSRIRRARQLLKEAIEGLAEGPAVLETTLTRLDEWARGLREQIGRIEDSGD